MQKTILVVEDEAVTAMDIQRKLQALNYHVPFTVPSGEEAIIHAKALKPDLILMDIVLQGNMDGIEAAKYINHHYHIPIVFLTAHNDNETIKRAKLALPYGYLTKPFDNNNLKITVELALFKHKMELETAEQSVHLKNEFLSNIAHEIRTPLNNIIGFATLLDQKATSSNDLEAKDFLSEILTYANSLAHLLSDIVDFTDAEAKKIKLLAEPIDLETLINELITSLNKRMLEKKINVKTHIDPNLKVTLDSTQLKKIIGHLLSNAIKFSNEGGDIEIHVTEEEHNQFKISVKDYGIGISEDNLQKLFIPFQQLDMGAAKYYQGTGLGLALTKRLIELQGGTIDVTSALGQGTTFFVILPLQMLSAEQESMKVF